MIKGIIINFIKYSSIIGILFSFGCQQSLQKDYHQLLMDGDYYFLNKKYGEALSTWEKALEFDNSNAEIYRKIGTANLKLANPYRAIKSFKEAIALEPSKWDSWIELVKVQLIYGDIPGAENSLKKLEETIPDDPRIKILKGDSEVIQNNLEEAKQNYLDALKLSPSSITAQIKLAICYASLSENDIANKYYGLIDTKEVKSPDLFTLLGNYWDLQYAYEKAEKFYLKAIEIDQEDISLQKSLANLYLKQNQYEKAEKILSKSLKKMPDNLSLIEELLECMISQNKIETARTLVNNIPNIETGGPEANFLRGKFHLLAGEPIAASNYFKLILDKTPDLQVVQYLMGVSYLASGKLHLARQAFVQTLMLDPKFTDADLALSDIFYKNREYELSLEHAIRVQKAEPENFRTYMIIGNIFLVQTKYKKAAEQFIQAYSIKPGAPEPLYFLAMTTELEGRKYDALPLYKKLVLKHPNFVDGIQGYTNLLLELDKAPTAIAFLNESISKMPDSGYLYCILGNCYIELNDIDVARKSFEMAISIMPELPNPYIRLSNIYEKLGYTTEQIKILEKCIENTFDYPDAYSELARVYQKLNEKDKAIGILETGVVRNPDAMVLANNLAWMYMEHDEDLNKAFDLAQKAYEFSSDDPIIADTLAWAYYKKGIYSMAEILLEESINLKDDYPIVHYHLGMVLKARGDEPKAKASFEKAISLGLEKPYLAEAEKLIKQN